MLPYLQTSIMSNRIEALGAHMCAMCPAEFQSWKFIYRCLPVRLSQSILLAKCHFYMSTSNYKVQKDSNKPYTLIQQCSFKGKLIWF